MGRKPRFYAGDAPFEAGAKVVVRCDDEGFRGAWYEATVIRLLHRRRRSYSVVYDSLVVDDDDPSRHLSEVVPGCHVRPRPPRLGAGAQYALHQLVDAYHNDGWWSGVVAAAAPSEGGDPPEKYTVAFHSSREVFEFGTSDVRQNVQWLRGQWIIPDEQAVSIFLSVVLRALGPDRGSYYDGDDDYVPARLPLLREQVQHAPYAMDPTLRTDSWNIKG